MNSRTGTCWVLVSKLKLGGRHFWETLKSDGTRSNYYDKTLRYQLSKHSTIWKLIQRKKTNE